MQNELYGNSRNYVVIADTLVGEFCSLLILFMFSYFYLDLGEF